MTQTSFISLKSNGANYAVRCECVCVCVTKILTVYSGGVGFIHPASVGQVQLHCCSQACLLVIIDIGSLQFN